MKKKNKNTTLDMEPGKVLDYSPFTISQKSPLRILKSMLTYLVNNNRIRCYLACRNISAPKPDTKCVATNQDILKPLTYNPNPLLYMKKILCLKYRTSLLMVIKHFVGLPPGIYLGTQIPWSLWITIASSCIRCGKLTSYAG